MPVAFMITSSEGADEVVRLLETVVAAIHADFPEAHKPFRFTSLMIDKQGRNGSMPAAGHQSCAVLLPCPSRAAEICAESGVRCKADQQRIARDFWQLKLCTTDDTPMTLTCMALHAVIRHHIPMLH